MINSKAAHVGNSGTEGDGVKLGEGLWFGWVGIVGVGTLYCVMSGYLSITTGATLFTYGVLPIPELSISVALGYLLA